MDSLAFLTSSAWRRREYFGGAHRPVLGFNRGRNGFGSFLCGEMGATTSGSDAVGAGFGFGKGPNL